MLARGTVEVLKSVKGSSDPKRIEVLQDGDYFGELALLTNVPRTTSVRTLAECTCLVLTREKFQALMHKAPELRWKLRESASIAGYREAEAGRVVVTAVSPSSKIRHDLLTPVNHMVGYSEMLLEETDAGNDVLRNRLDSIHMRAKQLQTGIETAMPAGLKVTQSLIVQLKQQLDEPITAILAQIAALGPIAGGDIDADVAKIAGAAQRLREMLGQRLASEASSLPQPRPSGAQSQMATGHLLVVDDNATSRELLSRRLEREGYRVSGAGDGLSALRLLEATSFDLVLLDVLMPDMNGYEMLQRIKSSDELAHIPVIMTSAMDEVDSAVRCIELGAEDYLTKPFDPILLRARIQACVQRKQVRDMEREKLRTALSAKGAE